MKKKKKEKKIHAAEAYRNGLYSLPQAFIKNLQLIHLKESHMKFTGKD